MEITSCTFWIHRTHTMWMSNSRWHDVRLKTKCSPDNTLLPSLSLSNCWSRSCLPRAKRKIRVNLRGKDVLNSRKLQVLDISLHHKLKAWHRSSKYFYFLKSLNCAVWESQIMNLGVYLNGMKIMKNILN